MPEEKITTLEDLQSSQHISRARKEGAVGASLAGGGGKGKGGPSALSQVLAGGGGGAVGSRKTTIAVTDIADSKAFDILLRSVID